MGEIPDDPREKLWSKAFIASIHNGRGLDFAADDAEKALAIYDKRWSADKKRQEVLAGGTIDGNILKYAIEQLKSDGRWDALLVVTSLYEAIKTSQATGQRLIEWPLPARG